MGQGLWQCRLRYEDAIGVDGFGKRFRDRWRKVLARAGLVAGSIWWNWPLATCCRTAIRSCWGKVWSPIRGLVHWTGQSSMGFNHFIRSYDLQTDYVFSYWCNWRTCIVFFWCIPLPWFIDAFGSCDTCDSMRSIYTEKPEGSRADGAWWPPWDDGIPTEIAGHVPRGRSWGGSNAWVSTRKIYMNWTMNMIFHCLWFLWFPFRWIIFPGICGFVLSLVFLLAPMHSNNYIVVDGLLNHPVSISLQFACASVEAFANRVEEAYKSRTMADCLLRPSLYLQVSLCFSLCFLGLVDWYYMTDIKPICRNMYINMQFQNTPSIWHFRIQFLHRQHANRWCPAAERGSDGLASKSSLLVQSVLLTNRSRRSRLTKSYKELMKETNS